MGKNSRNKRKSQNNEVRTPKKQKFNENIQKIDSNEKNTHNTFTGEYKNITPKGPIKNTHNKKLQKFCGTANLQDDEKRRQKDEDDNSFSEGSNCDLKREVKPEKNIKTINDNNFNSDADVDNINEEIDNAVNENSENDEKKQNKQKNLTDDIKESKIENKKNIKAAKKMRYVLFIGNLPYDITVEEVEQHFKNGIQVISVRFPKEKKQDLNSRGFGYLEVADKESYVKALTMHHTFLKGRRINVLYTTGGKKNIANAKSIIKSKNFKLNALRKEGILGGTQKHSNKRCVRRAKKQSFERKTE